MSTGPYRSSHQKHVPPQHALANNRNFCKIFRPQRATLLKEKDGGLEGTLVLKVSPSGGAGGPP